MEFLNFVILERVGRKFYHSPPPQSSFKERWKDAILVQFS
jgi:hypothetical protein